MIRPHGDWLLVRLDPIDRTLPSGLLVIEQGIRTGVVVDRGPGRLLKNGSRAPYDHRVGSTVAFVAALLQTKQGYALEGALAELYPGEQMGLIKESDVLLVLTGPARITV